MHALHCYILRELTAQLYGAIACQLNGCCFRVIFWIASACPTKSSLQVESLLRAVTLLDYLSAERRLRKGPRPAINMPS